MGDDAVDIRKRHKTDGKLSTDKPKSDESGSAVNAEVLANAHLDFLDKICEEELPEELQQVTNTDEKIKDIKFKSNLCVFEGTFWLTRIVFLRFLGFIYTVAFLVALHQNEALIGSDGLLPANLYMHYIQEKSGNRFMSFLSAPSLLWLLKDLSNIDTYLNIIAFCGLFLSFIVMVTGAANIIAMFLLWVLYQSIINVGQTWYSFGWESQLLETGFLAIFWCPLLTWKQLPEGTSPPTVVVWGFRWLLFRIMIGAGLIKIRGDKCWRNLTCMNYHYQTQPVPNPISYYMHQCPEILHKFETLSNHFIELVVPWFTFFTRRGQQFCGFVQILFQVVLIISGNLSFLNWLTLLPGICYFDDCFLARFFSNSTRRKVAKLQRQPAKKGKVRGVVHIILGLTIAYLSIPVVVNLLSSNQRMNYTYDPFRLVNTYGAFGSVTKRRTEVIIQGTYSSNPYSPDASWEEYEFKCKPGNVTRRPCLISPYHYRLDWLAWFAAFQSYQHNPWLVHLAAKLLVNDEKSTSLIEFNPFHNKKPPRYIRMEHYIYKFTKIGKVAANGKWWNRKRIGSYMPPVSIATLKPVLKNFNWNIPQDPYQ